MKRFFQAAAVLTAALLPAAARADYHTVQFGYSDPEFGNIVALIWDQATAGPVRVEVDGAFIGTVEGGAGRNFVSVTDVPEGEHRFEIFQGTTSLGSLNQEVLPTPMISGVALTQCTQSNNPNECEIEVTGESDGPPVTYIDIFVDGQFAVQAIETEDATEFGPVTVPITTRGNHEIVAQWTMEREDPQNFRVGTFISIGSTTCSTTCPISTGNRYTPGVCNGSGAAPDLSSPIFGLNFLFGSGAAPPCLQACDADDDGDVNLTDMIYVLNFLFSGGPAPGAWTDRNGDAVPDPACVTVAAAEECAASHASCAP